MRIEIRLVPAPKAGEAESRRLAGLATLIGRWTMRDGRGRRI